VTRLSVSFALLLAMAAFGPVSAEETACKKPETALGVSRIVEIDTKTGALFGEYTKHEKEPRFLGPKEVVLTFDDGPWPGTTPRVLDALKRECVCATFFLLGRNAAAHPQLARRELAEGHTVAHHTFSHPLLGRMRPEAAEAEINRGIAAVEMALYGTVHHPVRTPFFRFPGFLSSPAELDRLAARGITVFGADLWASDWDPMRPEQELALVLARLEASRGGIILFHDTKKQTAAMLPAFLRALKARGYRIVHVVPRAPRAAAKP